MVPKVRPTQSYRMEIKSPTGRVLRLRSLTGNGYLDNIIDNKQSKALRAFMRGERGILNSKSVT